MKSTVEMRALFVLTASAIAVTAASGTRAAGNPAWEFSSPGSATGNNGVGYNFGTTFDATQNVTVVGLGYYNDANVGVDFGGNGVALYDNNGNLLASATVLPGDEQIGHFLYATLNSPVTLQAGQTYQVDGAGGTSAYYTFDTNGFTSNPAVTNLTTFWVVGTTPDFQTESFTGLNDGF